MLCTSCGSAIPAGARFCPSCGHAVSAGQTEERRIVTVLFADLVGFTRLAEHLDPEQVKRLIDSCFEKLVDDVTAFGGRVDKILGDGILALFGAPVAHEDDPERAVRAALRMQQTVAEHVATNERARGADIRMRVGINTGEVLTGTLAGTDYTAMGDVVNTASRLQGAAPPGGVLVGETTYALTSHTFAYEDAGEIVARGREQALKTWLALQPTAPPGARRRHQLDVELVGRDPELGIGHAALDIVTAHQRGLVLSITGENGVGKSRFVDELIKYMRDTAKAAVLEGACVPYGEANVWWPIATALSTYLDIEAGLSAEEVRAAARRKATKDVNEMDTAEIDIAVEVCAHLLGYPSAIDRLDPVSARGEIHRTVTKVFDHATRQRPLLLSIDELHWADPVLIALLEHLVTSLARRPFVLATAMRPGADVVWPPRSDRSTIVALNLQPLAQDDTERLATALLRDSQVSPHALTQLYERSGGNPLFLQELVALRAGGGGTGELPDSLRTLIGARLDQLTTEQRQVLDNAATLGTSGAVSSLQRFGEATGQGFRLETVRELDDLGLLQLQGHRWQFRSDSVREAAYQTLTKAARAQRHAGIARAMSSNPAFSAADDMAHHAATAAELVQELGVVDHVPATITDDAVRLLTDAAKRARDAGNLRNTVRHATRAIDLLGNDAAAERTRATLQLIRSESLIDQRNYSAARADIDSALGVALKLADVVMEGEARRLLGSLHHVEAHLDLARAELGRAVELLRGTQRTDYLAAALRSRGFIELFGGSLIDAEWFFGEADAVYRTLDDQRGMAWIEQHRAWIAFLSGETTAAREQLQRAADKLNELGDRNGVGWAFGLLAFVEFFERHFAEAEALAEIVSKEADERGDDWAAGMMQTLLANLRLWQGKLDDALALGEQARHRFKKLNDKYGLMQSLAPILRAQIALGRTAASQRSAEELASIAETSPQGPFPLLAMAGAAMHRGDGASAASFAERATEEMVEAGGAAFEPLVILAMGRLLEGRLDDALFTLDRVDAEADEHPFTHAVAALVHTLARDPERALWHSDHVAQVAGATYLDQVYSSVAAAGAYAQRGDHQRAEAAAQAAVARAVEVGDVIAIALATRCFASVTGRTHTAHDERTQLGKGWVELVDNLVTAVSA